LALTAGAAAAQDPLFEPGADDRFSWDSYEEFSTAQDLSGQSLEILGPWTGKDATLIENVMAYFAAATGAEAIYSRSGNFD
jgi:alpha-glucoside transport system substrate-binding protein